ncbi:adenosylcobinamide-GDP ribazoletransferase [Tsukamurella soli]|uniref:Adenosylcobinamide-GDP ribazoletransferase n=1 Tax=Tsukamurella soli TaxID=644556 RepID=A0ABP8JBY4_9ACTN
MLRAVATAVSWMTVLPVPRRLTPAPTRESAGAVIAAVPVAGVLVGAAVTAVAWVSTVAGLSPLLAGVLAVGAAALVTRGMHLDALADCADGLGTYGPPERAREVMRQGTIGAFGAVALVLVLLAEVAAVATLAGHCRWYAIGVAVAASRVAAVIGCRRGWGPANPDGFGALTAGTQHPAVVSTWSAIACAAAIPASSVAWHGPVAVAAALAVAALVMRHCVRRFGGSSGDVYGLGIETATVIALVVISA